MFMVCSGVLSEEEQNHFVRRHRLILKKATYGDEEACQEAWARAIAVCKNMGDSERSRLSEGSFHGWLMVVARNVRNDAFRKQNLREKREEQGLSIEGFPEDGDNFTKQIEARELLVLEHIWSSLEPRVHEILYSRYVLGLSFREIGDKLDITEGTGRALLFRARKRARVLLEQLGLDLDEL